jgi:hypothetical protein
MGRGQPSAVKNKGLCEGKRQPPELRERQAMTGLLLLLLYVKPPLTDPVK